MRVEIRPAVDERLAEAIRRAVAGGAAEPPSHPAYRSRWRRSGLDYTTARPRSTRGATRA